MKNGVVYKKNVYQKLKSSESDFTGKRQTRKDYRFSGKKYFGKILYRFIWIMLLSRIYAYYCTFIRNFCI